MGWRQKKMRGRGVDKDGRNETTLCYNMCETSYIVVNCCPCTYYTIAVKGCSGGSLMWITHTVIRTTPRGFPMYVCVPICSPRLSPLFVTFHFTLLIFLHKGSTHYFPLSLPSFPLTPILSLGLVLPSIHKFFKSICISKQK